MQVLYDITDDNFKTNRNPRKTREREKIIKKKLLTFAKYNDVKNTLELIRQISTYKQGYVTEIYTKYQIVFRNN